MNKDVKRGSVYPYSDCTGRNKCIKVCGVLRAA